MVKGLSPNSRNGTERNGTERKERKERTEGTDGRNGRKGRTEGTDGRDGRKGRTEGTDGRDGRKGRTDGRTEGRKEGRKLVLDTAVPQLGRELEFRVVVVGVPKFLLVSVEIFKVHAQDKVQHFMRQRQWWNTFHQHQQCLSRQRQ